MTWPIATSVPILVFIDFSVLDLGPMYATDRQTSDAHLHSMPPTLGAAGGIISMTVLLTYIWKEIDSITGGNSLKLVHSRCHYDLRIASQ